MKENKKFKALKAGLGNGLVVTHKTYNNHCELIGLSESKGWLADKYKATGEIHVMAISTKNAFTGSRHYNMKNITPHFFPLPMLTKPIRIEGYNGGKEFVPMTELEDLFGSKFWIGNNFDGEILIQTLGTDKYLFFREMNQIVSMLHQWHFNVFNLDESEFIDASISKCYEPK
jgi:hypothetical protein